MAPTSGVKTYLLSEIGTDTVEKIATGPWDVVFGGGLAKSGVYLLGGGPGAGKTTLILSIANEFPGEPLFIACEQSKEEIKDYATRLGVTKDIRILPFLEAEESLGEILDQYRPSLLILDSLQGLCGDDIKGHNLVCAVVKRHAAKHQCPAIIISHITKDQMLAGRMTVQHMVDVTCMLFLSEEERILTTLKNRFGPAFIEQGFTMNESGLTPVPDKTLEARSLESDLDE